MSLTKKDKEMTTIKLAFNHGDVLIKRLLVLFNFIFLFQIVQCQVNDTIRNIKIDYSNTGPGTLRFTIKAVFDSTNSSIQKDTARTYKDIDNDIKIQVQKQLAKIKKLDLNIRIPSYINDIINLIPSNEDRIKARKIYIDHNIVGSVNNIDDNIFKMPASKSKKIIYSFTEMVSLPINNQDLTFKIKPITIKYFGKLYSSNPLTVVLGKGSTIIY